MDNIDYNKATTWEKLKYSFRSWRYIGVGKSLLIWFLTISIVPLASISFINFLNAYHGLTIVAEKSLQTTSQLREEYINTFFREITDFLDFNAAQKADIALIQQLSEALDQHNGDFKLLSASAAYKSMTASQRDEFKNLAGRNGYYDIYYINSKGDVLFSLKEESDLGTNLFRGEVRFSKFAATVRASLESGKTLFSDLEFYEPSYNKLSGFFVQPVVGENKQLVGAIALQVTMDRINQIISQEAGYGETGQAYLVGEDQLLRSALRFKGNNQILTTEVKNQKVKDWLFSLQNRNNKAVLIERELDHEKVSTYDSDLEGKYVLGIYRQLDYLENLGVNWVLIEEIEHSEAFAYARMLSDIVKITFIITIILVFLISILVTRWFVNPIKQLSSWAKEVAEGQLDNKIIKAPANEVGEMVTTFNKLVNALQKYAGVARLMAIGDYSEKVDIRSEKDVLGTSMNEMVESFRQVVTQANRIANGDYSVNVVPRSQNDTLNSSLYEMTKTLAANDKENVRQDWLKTGINLLDAEMSGISDVDLLAGKVLNFLSSYTHALAANLYVTHESGETLRLSAALGKNLPTGEREKLIEMGDGLIGQVAKTRTPIHLQANTQHIWIHTGQSSLQASEGYLFPLQHEGILAGVIEMYAIEPIDELKTTFFKMAGANIAIALRTAGAAEKVKELLRQTQEQANELAVQQEELRQANEELQEQAAALRLSEENLQAQQEELKVTNEELEERTRALEVQRDAIREKNIELEAARKEIEQKARDLEQASRYKSEFLANMSHELRTPLNSILVLSQLLAENKKQHLDAKELEYARTINSSGSDLLELINEILDLSKVESGKIELFIEPMYLEDVGTYVKKNFGPLADKKGLELFVNISKNLPETIQTDSQRLFQILKNLYSNALKFTHKGSITLNIYNPGKVDTAGNLSQHIAIAVKDTGIGIPNDKLQLIFNAFTQADGTTSRKYGGTGLGLSISKAFAELLGGQIAVESTEGEGTTFTLTLPIVPSENISQPKMHEASLHMEEAKIPADVVPVETVEPQPPLVEVQRDDRQILNEGDKVLLVIEDDQNFAALIRDMANEHHFKCLIANDGEAGLHYADYYLPSAIILDIGLPGIDGYEVMDRLKKNSRTRHIPVHFVSASDRSMESLKQGAIGYLRKPVSKESLEMALDKLESLVNGQTRRLLIVEDDDITRKSISSLMSADDVEIKAVASGEAAWEMLRNEPFDCMILDLGLQGMSGFELLENIKKTEQLKLLPVIIYTAHEMTPEENEHLQQFADSVIIKGARSFERLVSESTLFLHQVESKLPKNKQEMLKKILPREDTLAGKKLLIVDDDMRNVFALTSFLDQFDMKLIIARNGKEGIEKLNANPDTDLVLMDIMMPEMDGYEAMKIIRKDVRFNKLPIIALTAKAMKDDREKCIAAGANEYLTKPFDTSKLLSLLRVWLY